MSDADAPPTPSIFAERDFIDLRLPIRTERLVLRAGRLDDVDSLHARRNEPVNRDFQSWSYPYPRGQAEELIEGLVKMAGPTLGEWWMLTVDLPGEDSAGVAAPVGDGVDGVAAPVGDIAVHLDETGSIAEIGYTFASAHWGHGYATEAAGAVIDALFTNHPGLVRLQAQMHPDNLASAAVVERCGLVFEGQTRMSFIPRDSTMAPSDDRIYGMLRPDWEAWNSRPAGPPEQVDLIAVTAANVRELCDLTTHHSQDHLVAPVVHSLAEALVAPTANERTPDPWYRAVEADGELAGFVMLAKPNDAFPDPYLWRMLIDRRHQRRGIGRRVLDLVVDQAREWGGSTLKVSWVPGPGSPEHFYLGYGFVATGPPDEHGEVPGEFVIG